MLFHILDIKKKVLLKEINIYEGFCTLAIMKKLGGGAAIAANQIHNSLLKHGVDSMMLVKNKTSKSEKVIISEK